MSNQTRGKLDFKANWGLDSKRQSIAIFCVTCLSLGTTTTVCYSCFFSGDVDYIVLIIKALFYLSNFFCRLLLTMYTWSAEGIFLFICTIILLICLLVLFVVRCYVFIELCRRDLRKRSAKKSAVTEEEGVTDEDDRPSITIDSRFSFQPLHNSSFPSISSYDATLPPPTSDLTFNYDAGSITRTDKTTTEKRDDYTTNYNTDFNTKY